MPHGRLKDLIKPHALRSAQRPHHMPHGRHKGHTSDHVQIMHSPGKTSDFSFLSDSARFRSKNPRQFSGWSVFVISPACDSNHACFSITTHPNRLILALGASDTSPLRPSVSMMMMFCGGYGGGDGGDTDVGVGFFLFWWHLLRAGSLRNRIGLSPRA